MQKHIIVFITILAIIGALATSTIALIDNNVALKRQIETLENENDILENEIDTLEGDISELQSINLQLSQEVNESLTAIDFLKGKIDSLQQSVEESRFTLYYDPLKKNSQYGLDYLEYCLPRWAWIQSRYNESVFDCSEMSAYLEWKLENEGFHTYIVVGPTPSTKQGYHAWLLVETSENNYTPVEATCVSVVKKSLPYYDDYFEYDRSFETIQDAVQYDPNEFDWWNP